MRRQSCEGADADCQTTRCPGIGERDDPDRRGALIPAGCRCWNHSQTNSATNHLASGIEAGKADTQFQATAGAGSVVFHLILEGVTRRKANMVISKGIAKQDRPLLAHHMISRRDQHEPVLGEGKCLKFFCRIDLVPDDADLGEASSDSAHDVTAGIVEKLYIHTRDMGVSRHSSPRLWLRTRREAARRSDRIFPGVRCNLIYGPTRRATWPLDHDMPGARGRGVRPA
jgi:hypothetical protein